MDKGASGQTSDLRHGSIFYSRASVQTLQLWRAAVERAQGPEQYIMVDLDEIPGRSPARPPLPIFPPLLGIVLGTVASATAARTDTWQAELSLLLPFTSKHPSGYLAVNVVRSRSGCVKAQRSPQCTWDSTVFSSS